MTELLSPPLPSVQPEQSLVDCLGSALKVAAGILGVPLTVQGETSSHSKKTDTRPQEHLSWLVEHAARPFDQKPVMTTLFDMAHQLNPHLASYDLVVGDDTSGRLPALLYWRLVNARRAEQGLPPAAIRFMNGRYQERVPKKLFPKAGDKTARALLVTEYIHTGGNVYRIYEAMRLSRRGKRIDVASLGSDRPTLQLQHGARFFFQPRPEAIGIDSYLYSEGLDVQKGVHKERHSEIGNRYLHSRALPKACRQPAKTARARQDINRIAQTFYALLPPAL